MKNETKEKTEIMEIISKHTRPKVRGPGGVLYDKEASAEMNSIRK